SLPALPPLNAVATLSIFTSSIRTGGGSGLDGAAPGVTTATPPSVVNHNLPSAVLTPDGWRPPLQLLLSIPSALPYDAQRTARSLPSAKSFNCCLLMEYKPRKQLIQNLPLASSRI